MLKKLFGLAASFAALVGLPAGAWAQTAKDADPAIWVVKDADTTIYLFGTVHVLKPGLSWFDEGVKAAFDKSDEVVLEMIEPDAATMQGVIIKAGLSMTGPGLSEKLPKESLPALAVAAKDLGMPESALERFEPWLAAMMSAMAPLSKYGYDPESGAERTISAAAKAANKQLIGIETFEQQVGFFDGLPEEQQIKYLVTTLRDYEKAGPMLDEMVANWAAGDPDTLATTMNDAMRENPEVAKVLLADRNAHWAEWIEQRMAKPGTVFMAVGAGHLAGDDSVQTWLAKRKLTATRVQY
ncbi:MAG: TraB/GumN family protein [Pseudomonadota bacterium]